MPPILPQFPLGSVLFPSMVLPLHVFEPRYRVLVRDLLDGDRRFGVVLIERGREVGGDDDRSDFGTVAEVVQAEELPDGRWHMVAVGTERVRIARWLDDDPYPRAEIEPWPDEDPEPPPESRFREVETRFRRLLALASEAGIDTGPPPEPVEPTELGTMQLAALLPIEMYDKQQLLGTPGSGDRLEAIDRRIEEAAALFEHRLRQG